MRFLRLLLACSLLAGCCILPDRYSLNELPDEPKTFVEVLSTDQVISPTGSIWEVRVRFYEKTRYPHIIQILHLSDGTVLVEAFKTPGGRFNACHFDRHAGSYYGLRTMLVYPGTVVGGDWTDKGFCQVIHSEAGERTTVGPNFNAEYQQSFSTTGYVLNGDRSLGFVWTIDARADGLEVNTPAAYTLQAKTFP